MSLSIVLIIAKSRSIFLCKKCWLFRTSLQEYLKLLEESRDIDHNDEHVLEKNGQQAQLAKLKLWIQTDEYFSSLGQVNPIIIEK